MNGLVKWVRSALLNHLFGKATMTPPTIYVGLSSTTPTSDGTNITEPTEGGYARVATTAADWNIAVDGDPCVVDNANAFTFPRALGIWAGGNILTHAVLFSSPTEMEVVGVGELSVQKPVYTDDTAQYAAGAIRATLAGTE